MGVLVTPQRKLARWLGDDAVEKVQYAMKDWYGPPIALHGVPGAVFAMKGGDFTGPVRANRYSAFVDYAVDRIVRGAKRGVKRWSRMQQLTLNTGFASLSDLISEATTGKRREFQFLKSGPTGVLNVTSSLWRLGSQPAAGAAPGNAAGGTAFDDTGAFPFTNPGSPDTQHFVTGYPLASVAGNTLLLYDLIYGCNKTMNSVANEAVTGVPTRYQSSTSSDADYAGGNFLFIQVGGTQLAATAHNWGVAGGANECLYRNQAGTDNTVLPVLTGNSGAIVDRLDHPAGQWFAPLATGDTGVKDLAQMRCSALVATGVAWFMIGHPIAWMPCPVANLVCVLDGINSAFNLVRIFDDACLAFLEVCKPSTTATTYTGSFTTVAG